MRRSQSIHRQQPQGRLAVNQNHIILFANRVEGAGERHFPGDLVNHLNLGSGKIDIGRHQIHTLDRSGMNNLLHINVAIQEHIVDSGVQVVAVYPQSRSRGTLGIKIYNQHLAPILCQRRSQVNGGSSLTNPAFLVAHGNNPRGPMRL